VPRIERFGVLVAEAVDRLEPRWRAHTSAVDVEVQDAPPVVPGESGDRGEVPLAGYRPAGPGSPLTVVVYRRPVELRAPDRPARVDLVRDLVAEQLADALGLAPGDLDPSYDDRAD
jgi:predicted Zn-dependent protease with MMP-like domain